MVKIIIRDDDLNYFSKVEDLKIAYSEIPDFPISFAVVPYVKDLSTKGSCPETKGNVKPRPIADNIDIINYIKQRIKEGKTDVLLHSQTHGYIIAESGERIPEMRQSLPTFGANWTEAIRHDKQYLSDLFGINIKCFAAPSNTIAPSIFKSLYIN